MDDNPFYRFIWPLLAAVAGAITGLSLRPYHNLSRNGVILSLVANASFAIFGGPLVALWIFGHGPVNLQMYGSILYFLGAGSNTLLPLMLKRFGLFAGAEEQK